MSALPSPSHNQGSIEPAADPSMEEILASIRRIIADDHGTPITPRPSRAAQPGVAVAEAPAPQALPEWGATQPRAEPPRLRANEEQPLRRAPVEPASPRETEPSLKSINDRIARLEAAPARPVLRSAPEPAQPAVVAAPAPEPVIEPPAARQAQAPSAESPSMESLLSPLARASVTSAFEALTVSMAVQNGGMVEEAVRDMLRPMLKQWLDDNLPTIVERLVRAEIERVARGGRA